MGQDFDYSVRFDQLKITKKLGKGGFGVVHLAQDELTKQMVAVKILDFAEKPMNSEMMKKEVEALSNMRHKHIVELLESFPRPEKH